MEKKLFTLLPPLILGIFLFFGCNKDNKPKNELLKNSWKKLYVAADASFNVKLTFLENGTFTWNMIDVVATHSNSTGEYVATDTQITLVNDHDCGVDGTYSYSIIDDQLKISLLEDNCSQRIPGFSGDWEKY